MLADCPECETQTVAGLDANDDVSCQTCGTDLSAGDIATDDADLTEREWEALGKQGDAPEEDA